MKSVDNVEKLIRRANAVPSAKTNCRTLNDIFEAQEESRRANAAAFEPNMWRIVLGNKAGCLAAALLVVSSLLACFAPSLACSAHSGMPDHRTHWPTAVKD